MIIKQIYKVFILIFFILVTITSCDFFAKNGGLGISLNIKDSKNRKVFIQEYKSVKNPLKINDTLIVNIKSAWLEHSWRYSGYESKEAEIENDDSYQLIVIADNHSLKGYSEDWLISSTPDSTFYKGYKGSIHTRLDNRPSSDTVAWKVQSGNVLGKANPKTIIGKLLLIRQK